MNKVIKRALGVILAILLVAGSLYLAMIRMYMTYTQGKKMQDSINSSLSSLIGSTDVTADVTEASATMSYNCASPAEGEVVVYEEVPYTGLMANPTAYGTVESPMAASTMSQDEELFYAIKNTAIATNAGSLMFEGPEVEWYLMADMSEISGLVPGDLMGYEYTAYLTYKDRMEVYTVIDGAITGFECVYYPFCVIY